MCDPVTAAVIVSAVVTAGATGYQASESQKAQLHAKDVADKQKQDTQNAISAQEAKDQANLKNKANTGGATQKQAIDAIRASMAASSGMGGTILTNPQGSPGTPTTSKTMLGA
jgi:deoxyxylulose-5-phosphate synthase